MRTSRRNPKAGSLSFVVAVALLGVSLSACRTDRAAPVTSVREPLEPLHLARLETMRWDLEGRIEQSEGEDGWFVAGAVAVVQRDFGQAMIAAIGRPRGPGLGVRASELEIELTENTIFPIHSMTKPIVSVAVLQLVEEGRLALEDPIERYLPEFAEPEVAQFDDEGRLIGTRPATGSVTIADLLGHTSGLGYALFAEGGLRAVYEQAGLDREFASNRERSCAIADLPLAFDPGTQWRYGRSTDVLGALLEELEGETLGAILSRRVLEPLGMVDTAFFVSEDGGRRERIAWNGNSRTTLGSAAPPELRLPASYFVPEREPAACNAGGGLYSTAMDYHAFCEMLLGEGESDGVRLLQPETVRLMTRDRIAGLPRQDFLGERGFGLGVAVLTEDSAGPLNGTVGSFHWSGIEGTSFFVDPEERLIGVFLIRAPRDFSYMVAFRKGVYASLPGNVPEPSALEPGPSEPEPSEPVDSPSPLSVGGSDVGE